MKFAVLALFSLALPTLARPAAPQPLLPAPVSRRTVELWEKWTGENACEVLETVTGCKDNNEDCGTDCICAPWTGCGLSASFWCPKQGGYLSKSLSYFVISVSLMLKMMIVTVSYHPAHPTPATPTLDDPSSAPLVNPHVSSTPVSPSRPNVLISEQPSTHVVDVPPRGMVLIVLKSPTSRMSTVNTELARSILANEDSSSRMGPHVSPTPNIRASRTSLLAPRLVPAKSGLSRSMYDVAPKTLEAAFIYNQHCFPSPLYHIFWLYITT